MNIEASHRYLLHALCIYHDNLKQEVITLREDAEKEINPHRKNGLYTKCSYLTTQRHAIRWFLFRQKEELFHHFTTDNIEHIAGLPLDSGGDLDLIGTIPAAVMGAPKRLKVPDKRAFYRLRGIAHSGFQES